MLSRAHLYITEHTAVLIHPSPACAVADAGAVGQVHTSIITTYHSSKML